MLYHFRSHPKGDCKGKQCNHAIALAVRHGCAVSPADRLRQHVVCPCLAKRAAGIRAACPFGLRAYGTAQSALQRIYPGAHLPILTPQNS